MFLQKKVTSVILVAWLGTAPLLAGECYDQFVDDSYVCAGLETWYERSFCELGAEAMYIACLADE